jgi:beta-glucanase (GH16 family)
MKTKHTVTLASIYLALLALVGCSKDSDNCCVMYPEIQSIEVTVSATNPAEVTVQAKADAVNFYNIYFGEAANETPVRSANGKATHTYAKSGKYTIKVQAHTTDQDFVSGTKDVTVTVSGDLVIPTTGYETPTSYAGMNLVWQDEFDGTSLNPAWTFETGTGQDGWGNNELQYYRSENTALTEGKLIITAKKEAFQGSQYTSSRIVTAGKQEFLYGRVDIRAVLPKGQGIWPALWMLGANYQTDTWPRCGEIDIMEMVGGGGKENTVHGTVHWDANGNYASYTKHITKASGTYSDEFHVYSLVWTPQAITWLVDDQQFNVIDTTPEALSEFQKKFFLIFNVAVGGRWPGSPDGTTIFPQRMIVDYVRVFQQNNN